MILLGVTYAPECRSRIDKHLDGYYTIQYMSSGAVELAYDDDQHLMEGSWFWPAYPGPRTVFHCAPGHDHWFHRHVGFSGELVFEWIDSGLWLTGPQRAPEGCNYAELFDRLIAQASRTDSWGRLRAINLIEQILIQLAEARSAPAAQQNAYAPEWLPRVIDRITSVSEAQYDAIAAAEGMSASTLRRHFRRAMGLSVHQYVIRRRVEKARSLLCESDLPIKAIADSLGYENQFYFSRQFREVMGVSPGLFRRNRQGPRTGQPEAERDFSNTV